MASPVVSPSPAAVDVDLDKVYGTVYGQCTGDAIGLLTEFMDRRKAHKYYQPPLEYNMKVSDRHRNSWKTGDWTDDSDQMILIMQALTHTGGKVSDDTLRTFSGDLYTWMLDGFQELGDRGGCGLGRTTHTVLTHPEFFDNPMKAAQEVWEGTGKAVAPNGAVMRTSILGVQQFWDLDTVGENAKLFCQTTHADPRCVASCVAVTTAIAQMLQGETDVEKIIHKSFRRASAHLHPDEKQVDELRWYMDPRQLEELQLDAQGVIGYTYKTLGAGFWALRQNDFRKAIERITMEAGDADTNAAVAGALLGCRLGRRSLPDSWVKKMPHKEWLDWQISK
ncbi:Hypp3232 [Branchiostoma lanceolatum]|uniref:Hypp3232 protein n=1 Tax=Branchiostoma lanceolatum TaxID=7740 RepID=A0A8J9ZY54_BRALA|nr:Hypp3232 [Branchiostoma lanceolatum]